MFWFKNYICAVEFFPVCFNKTILFRYSVPKRRVWKWSCNEKFCCFNICLFTKFQNKIKLIFHTSIESYTERTEKTDSTIFKLFYQINCPMPYTRMSSVETGTERITGENSIHTFCTTPGNRIKKYRIAIHCR